MMMIFIKEDEIGGNVARMSEIRNVYKCLIPSQILCYQPKGQRALRIPFKSWHEILTGHCA